MDLFLFSSHWRCHQVSSSLREYGHSVRCGGVLEHKFDWRAIDQEWEKWTPDKYLGALHSQRARDAFDTLMREFSTCEAGVPFLPCSPSEWLTAGVLKGKGLRLAILLSGGYVTPALMYLSADWIGDNLLALRETLAEWSTDTVGARRLLQHALGLDTRKKSYRNRYVAAVGSPRSLVCERLLSVGLLEKIDSSPPTDPQNALVSYRVTEAGRRFVERGE